MHLLLKELSGLSMADKVCIPNYRKVVSRVDCGRNGTRMGSANKTLSPLNNNDKNFIVDNNNSQSVDIWEQKYPKTFESTSYDDILELLRAKEQNKKYILKPEIDKEGNKIFFNVNQMKT